MEYTHNIKIHNESFGLIVDETFVNPIQFKLFLKLINSCVEMNQDLTFFNGTDFFIHVPCEKLKKSIIVTKVETYTVVDHLRTKSKIESDI